ncbi:MAG: UDP-N-acetylmuramoyl-L-alanine--D-glutamate ligase [Desulfobacterales bacterium]|nr:UDP-N-acetylmuramoyl-L-alanine--D-glutamate ligase [Desulfobacterales bacterium]
MMELLNKQVVVVGLARTGVAVCRFLKGRGARVIVTDSATARELEPFIQQLRGLDIPMELGGHQIDTFEKSDLVVLSPGVPHTILPVRRAMDRGVPVLGEMELASRYISQPVVAVTGTNGKTTTTELLGKMLACSGLKVFVGGNIGTPLIEFVTRQERADVVVAEVSSFQLDTIGEFKPKVGVLLNVTEDHMDRYPDFESYARSKYRIFENQRPEDVAVINGADVRIRAACDRIRSRKLFFNAAGQEEAGARLNGTRIIFDLKDQAVTARGKSSKPECLYFENTGLTGRHNMENAAAATLAALAAGASLKGAQAALNDFKGLPHRLEYVDTLNGVAFYNDSKATNADAVIRALEAMNRPVILIMGGQGKGCDFSVLQEPIRRRVKKLVVMGEAAAGLLSALAQAAPTATAVSMEDAVSKAYRAAASKDAVLLSPGCASFDMFHDYAHRGEVFCATIQQLKRDHARK